MKPLLLIPLVLVFSGVTARPPIQKSHFVKACNPELTAEPRSKLTRKQIDRVVKAVRASFSILASERKTLDPVWQALNDKHHTVASTGFCVLGANAIYHLLGGKKSGLTPVQATYFDPELEEIDPSTEGKASHWWVRDADGNIIDPTYDQYTAHGDNPPYDLGRGRGFNTRPNVPLNAARELIRLAKRALREQGYRANGLPLDGSDE